MEFRVLGPLEVIREGTQVPLGGPQQRAVLLHLLLCANRPVAADRLIANVWGDEPPPAVRSSLQAYVSRLRKALGSHRLEGRAGAYVLRVDPAAIDASRFERLVERARDLTRTEPAAAAATYAEALACWRGPALDDLADDPSLRPEAVRLEALRLAATEERVEAELAAGNHSAVVPELESLTARHPLRERLWGQLVVALYRCGRQADALAAFRRARKVLLEELGVDPSPTLQDLHDRVLRQDPALDAAGVPLRGYRLLGKLGEGPFGVVHRAVQAQVGREVAVKAAHPGLANDPEFIRRFEAEAQLVAALEHPHVVPLYDFWREPDGAYLVVRYLRGGSLRDVLRRGPLDPETTMRVVEQVGLALTAAHRQGIVHGGVKPENVLFDEYGNAYLSDFAVGRNPPGGDAPGTGADIRDLGLVVAEMSAGLPAVVDEVVARATAGHARDGHADVSELVAALRACLRERRPAAVTATGARNPYKGLRSFTEGDAGDFFGRERLVGRLVARMAEDAEGARFLAVVGASGSGKTSLVRAGLVPALRNGALPGSQEWFVVDLVPGTDPFAELRTALRRVAASPLPPNLVARFEHDAEALMRAATWVLPGSRPELVLVVDQFEELFTLVADAQRRAAFLAGLVAAATDPDSRIRVVITLRADFYDRPLAHRDLAELVRRRTEVVVPLTPAELERAVAGPAERVGVAVDPGLVAQMAADVADQPGALPLLQYALTELFDRRRDATLRPESYVQLGGVAGALARRAEEVHAGLPRPVQQAARQMFLRLVTLGEGTPDTRRRVPRAELASLEGEAGAMEAAIEAFGHVRLVSYDRDPDTREPTVEVAHEALIREWPRLRAAVNGARDDLRTQRRLAAAAREWHEAGRDPAFLATGRRLEQFQTSQEQSALALTPDERAFLAVSRAERDRRTAEEDARRARERALERHSYHRLRALVAVFAVGAVVAAALTIVAVRQAGQRAEQVRIATARELAAAAVANLDVDPERSILLALEAVDTTWASDGTAVREAEEALHRAVKASRLVFTVPDGHRGVALSADGTRFATTSAAGTATVRETEGGQELTTLHGHEGPVNSVAFGPDGRLLATSGDDGTVRIWDAASGRQRRLLRAHERFASGAAFSPDGRWLATTGGDGAVRLWDVVTGDEERVLEGHQHETHSPAFSPDGSRLATASGDATARVWDPSTGESVLVLEDHDWPVSAVAFGPDGTRLVTASNDHTARIWDAGSGDPLLTLSHPTSVLGVDYEADGTRVATVGSDGTARVWDVGSGRELMRLPGHAADTTGVAFTPDGRRLLTTGRDATTRAWDLTVGGARDWLTVPGASGIYTTVAFSPDGERFAAPADPSGVTIWDVRTGEEVVTLGGFDRKLTTVAFSPDGRRIAAGSDLTATPPVWDVETGELLLTLTGHADASREVAFSPDGRLLATGSDDGTARVWDALTGDELGRIHPDGGPPWAVGFSPDGRFLVTGETDGSVTVWAVDRLERVRTLSTHTQVVNGVAFGPGGIVVTGSWDGTAKVWNLASGEELATLRGHDAPVTQVAVTPDGTRIATGGEDGTARVWDAETGRQLLTLHSHDLLIYGVAFSPDGRLLATASPDGTISLHLLALDEFLELARERVTRTLSDEECGQYLHARCPRVAGSR